MTLRLVSAGVHVKPLGQDPAADRILSSCFLKPIMQFMREGETAIDFRRTRLGSTEKESDSQNAPIQSSAHTAGLSGSDRHGGRHGNHCVRYIYIKRIPDGTDNGFAAQEPILIEFNGILSNFKRGNFRCME